MNRMAAPAMALLAAISLAGCSPATKPAQNQATDITVDASDAGCALSRTELGTGSHTFVITNSGTKVTEFYVYGQGQQVLAEAENISPGLQRRLEVRFDRPGNYQTACKPGMAGDGIRANLIVNP